MLILTNLGTLRNVCFGIIHIVLKAYVWRLYAPGVVPYLVTYRHAAILQAFKRLTSNRKL